jgi:hypothetical protein
MGVQYEALIEWACKVSAEIIVGWAGAPVTSMKEDYFI